ncbi:MAG: hypothetical protein JXA25_00645 [Anaerolineales bacterium]|nr:hypothetical protein [Anaerolineales bacterium]
MSEILPILILNARPAAGKSEVIHYLQSLSDSKRQENFHLGPLYILDDFPILWRWFEQDDLLGRVFNLPRLFSDKDGYFLHQEYWHLLIEQMNLIADQRMRDYGENETILIEFSRGSEHGGYQQAYQHLSQKILKKAAALYIKVSFEESLRKNRSRFNPDRPDSILEHGLSDKKLTQLYKDDDWADFSSADPAYLHVKNHRIPYVVFDNERDLTTEPGPELVKQLKWNLDTLWEHWRAKGV